MLDAVLSFVIIITNPVGVAAQTGYPNVVYQTYVAPGERVAKSYSTQEQCRHELQRIVAAETDKLQAEPRMPEYTMVMRQRIASMQCLPVGSKPEPRLRGQYNAQNKYSWRIGKINELHYFEGQPFDLRQFNNEWSCKSALNELLDSLLGRDGSSFGVTERLRNAYHCYKVWPDREIPGRNWVERSRNIQALRAQDIYLLAPIGKK